MPQRARTSFNKEDITSFEIEKQIGDKLRNPLTARDFILNLIFFMKLKGLISEEDIQKRLIDGDFDDLRKYV